MEVLVYSVDGMYNAVKKKIQTVVIGNESYKVSPLPSLKFKIRVQRNLNQKIQLK